MRCFDQTYLTLNYKLLVKNVECLGWNIYKLVYCGPNNFIFRLKLLTNFGRSKLRATSTFELHGVLRLSQFWFLKVLFTWLEFQRSCLWINWTVSNTLVLLRILKLPFIRTILDEINIIKCHCLSSRLWLFSFLLAWSIFWQILSGLWNQICFQANFIWCGYFVHWLLLAIILFTIDVVKQKRCWLYLSASLYNTLTLQVSTCVVFTVVCLGPSKCHISSQL